MVVATGDGGDDDGIAANEKLAIMKFFFGWAIKCHGDDGSDGGSGHGSNGVYYFLSKALLLRTTSENGNTHEIEKTSIINWFTVTLKKNRPQSRKQELSFKKNSRTAKSGDNRNAE